MAIASEFDYPVYSISLGEIGLKDSDLTQLIQAIPRGSILLLEDIHASNLGQERLGSDDRTIYPRGTLSTTGLLNAIDGLLTPHGLVMIATTNSKIGLDEALFRPGRLGEII
jgi:chaperone BCS1